MLEVVKKYKYRVLWKHCLCGKRFDEKFNNFKSDVTKLQSEKCFRAQEYLKKSHGWIYFMESF